MSNYKHGMSSSRSFKIWLGMIDRCRNDRTGHYGARGIRVCERWLASFENFYADMGDPPSAKHSIDRIDVNGHYEPANCRWATSVEQARNTTRNTVLSSGGRSLSIAGWSEATGIKSTTICRRLANGWSVTDALSAPVRPWRLSEPWTAVGMSRSSWYRARQRVPT